MQHIFPTKFNINLWSFPPKYLIHVYFISYIGTWYFYHWFLHRCLSSAPSCGCPWLLTSASLSHNDYLHDLVTVCVDVIWPHHRILCHQWCQWCHEVNDDEAEILLNPRRSKTPRWILGWSPFYLCEKTIILNNLTFNCNKHFCPQLIKFSPHFKFVPIQ